MINYQLLIDNLIIYATYLLPLLLIISGLLLIFRTELMLTLTAYLERLIGAMWVPSKRTNVLYKLIGILLLALGCLYLGYMYGK